MFVVPPPELVAPCLGGLIGAVGTERSNSPRTALLDTVVAHVFGSDLVVADTPELDPAELAARIADPKLRRQLVDAMVVLEGLDAVSGGPRRERIDHYATQLGVSTTRLQVVRDRVRAHREHMELDRARIDGREDRDPAHSGSGDERLAARWQRLEGCPPGSLGRGVWELYRVRGWPFPGEQRAAPEATCRHDFVHVLADYDATPIGEIEVAGFIGAGKAEDLGFAFLLVALAVWEPDVLDDAGGSERLADALGRGTRCGMDLLDGLDHFALAAEQLETLRLRFRVPPKSTLSEGAAHLGTDAGRRAG